MKKIKDVKKIFAAIASLFVMNIANAQLTDHGIASAVSEGRGIIAHRNSAGEPIIITVSQDKFKGMPRASLLIIDAKTGKINQYWHPLDGPKGENTASRESFSSMLASNGKFYSMFGNVFLEFDLDKRQWTYSKEIEGMAMSYAEAPDGKIFFANYPKSTLYSFNPASREFRYYGQLDDVEKYPFSLAAGKDGWIYAGIGTAKSNLVAFNPETGIRIGLVGEKERETGEGQVFLAEDNTIYATHLKDQKAPLYRMQNGQKIEIKDLAFPFPKKAVTGFVFWHQRINDFPGGGKIQSFVMREKTAKIADEKGNVYNINFDYKSDGAGITSMVLGPDAAIWGSTAHPLRLWRFDPTKNSMGDWKGMKEIPGGNFPNLITFEKKIYGALYNGGMVWSFDVSKDWNGKSNPLSLGKFTEIARPRAATLTSDGKNVVFGGYPGYGVVGGDLVFVNTADDKATLVKVQDQLPGLSTIVLRSLPEGILVGGTSIAAPGGGTPTASQAKLFLMDEHTRKVIFQTVPVSSGRDIESLEVRNGLVYGVTGDAQLFVFNPKTKQIVSQTDVSAYGSPTRPGQSLILASNGKIYGIFSKSIFEIDSNSKIIKLVDLPEPATAGIAFHNDRLYFGCGSKVWSYKIK